MPDKPATKSDRKSEPRAHETSSRPGHVPFASLGLSADLLKAVAQLGFEETSPIQSAAIPLIIAGIDVVGQSETGSGKTAAFCIPAIEIFQNGALALSVDERARQRSLADIALVPGGAINRKLFLIYA